MTNAIELNHISKSFGEFSLKNVTLAIPAGTICGLVGENGAGKSTLIRILMGALRPDSGTAAALGVDVSAPEFLNAKEDIGVVLDEGCFPETLTAPQVGRVMAATYRRWEQDTFDAYCRRFALPEKTAFKDYSRGMKMKLTIAVALSHQAQLLVLDEATAGLDPVVRDSILEELLSFVSDEEHAVLPSSHITGDLEKIAEEIEQDLQNSMEREVSTETIGEKVMERLRNVDQVAYVRFASVYRQFKDIDTFMAELNKLLADNR